VILSQQADPAYVLELFESGSEGRAYLLKEHVGDLAQLVAASPLDELTAREREVLTEVATGKSNAAIAA
jgi:DNA-binding NarL/FixJ family response regulator